MTRTHTLPAGDTVTDTLVISLTRGLRPVGATLRADEAHNPGLFSHSLADAWTQTEALTLSVRADNDLRLTASGAPTVTAVITNVGWNAFTGTLKVVGQRDVGAALAAAPFSSIEQSIHVPVGRVGNSSYFTATMDTADLSPGAYTVTLEVWAENGALVKSTAITGTVPAPDFAVTQVPTQTTLRSNEVVTLTFGVENRGGAPDLASFHFALGDLADEVQKQWVAAGATALFTYTTYVPLDMPTMDVYATYAVTSTDDPAGDAGHLVFHVEGISLTVEASTDRPFYQEGEPANVILNITNVDTGRDTGDLTALMAFNGITRTQAFSLTPAAQVALTFPYTATFLADRKIFYGLYGQQSDRGAYLNTLYLYRRNPGVTLQLEREVYRPGATLRAGLVTTLTQGTLNVYVLGQGYTLSLGSDTEFTYNLPADLARGSYALAYTVHGCDCFADGREQTTWFDVAAPWVRVVEARLGQGPYEPGQVVSATLNIASDGELDAEMQHWIRYPDGSEGAVSVQPVHLEARLDNQVVISSVITDTQMGLHRLLYRLAPPGTRQRLRARQADQAQAEAEEQFRIETSESFDVGLAGLDAVTTDQMFYAGAGDPVQARLDVYSLAGGAAQVVISLDAGPTNHRAFTLAPGYQTLTVPLTGPIPPGVRVLTARLEMDGYWTTRQTVFAYGTELPDLRAAPPGVSPGGPAPTLQVAVFNEGQATAPATTLALYQGTSTAGSLLGTLPVPALGVGEGAFLTFAWYPDGSGGPKLISARADAGGVVPEFDEANNESSATLTPCTAAALTAAFVTAQPAGPGGRVTLTARVGNSGGEPLPAGLPVAFYADGTPIGTAATAQALNAGGSEEVSVTWSAGTPGAHTLAGGVPPGEALPVPVPGGQDTGSPTVHLAAPGGLVAVQSAKR